MSKLNLSEIQAVHGIERMIRHEDGRLEVHSKSGLVFIGRINLTRRKSYVIVGPVINIKDLDHAKIGILKSS